MVNFFTFTFTLPSKYRKRHNIFQTTLSNNIQISKNLLTNFHFFTYTLNQTGLVKISSISVISIDMSIGHQVAQPKVGDGKSWVMFSVSSAYRVLNDEGEGSTAESGAESGQDIPLACG